MHNVDVDVGVYQISYEISAQLDINISDIGIPLNGTIVSNIVWEGVLMDV